MTWFARSGSTLPRCGGSQLRMIGSDERSSSGWLSEPVRPFLYERVIPGVVLRIRVPDEYAQAPRDLLEAYAADFARRARHKVCLRVDNRNSTWFAEDGTLESRSDAALGRLVSPFMILV